MWPDLTNVSVPYADLALRGAVVYFAVLLLMRISGKRQMGQMTATEFVAVLLISNAVQNAMNGGDNSLTGGLLLAAVLIFLSWSVGVATYRSRLMSRIFEGTPTLLVHNGQVIEKNLRRELLSHAELRTLLRKQGIHELAEIRDAVLEADGSLSISKVTGNGNGNGNDHES